MDRLNIQSQLDHLQMKYVGTGHADLNKFDWVQNHHRDTYASFYGHDNLANFIGVAKNQSIGRVKYELLTKIIKPINDNPIKEEE